jgi:maltooligosyltrehalose trehalohydrolase
LNTWKIPAPSSAEFKNHVHGESNLLIETADDRPLGATFTDDGSASFLVWAPRASRVDLRILAPNELLLPMHPLPGGYFYAERSGSHSGVEYKFILDGEKERPDPASRLQPHGVHGPSQLLRFQFEWSDHDWRGVDLSRYVIYELHVGTFTPEGTFDAIIPRLAALKNLGITAIEIMPVAQFPGDRNWGYDGVYPFAVQNSYGGPEALKRLVDACHRAGMAAILDVVYNHLGPEGNYSADFGPYFTKNYKTEWGDALNFEGPDSDGVRRYFIENALQWVNDFHFDALRLDAVHAILDISARPFIRELASAVEGAAEHAGRPVYLMPESNRNDAHMMRATDVGGWNLDSVWNDDFHHALHHLLTGEHGGYYADYDDLDDLACSLRQGFIFTGQYSKYRRRRHGNSTIGLGGEKFIVFAQNHDQIGNRRLGDRLTKLVSFEALKLAAAAVLLSPFVPFIFMGEEYGEEAPFQYFVSHSDADLVEAVRTGRRAEFSSFDEHVTVPDPQSPDTFLASKLNWDLREQGRHRTLLNFYCELLHLRSEIPALSNLDLTRVETSVTADGHILSMHRWHEASHALVIFHFGNDVASAAVPIPSGRWRTILDSSDSKWGEGGSVVPKSLESTGEVALELQPNSALLLVSDDENEKRS